MPIASMKAVFIRKAKGALALLLLFGHGIRAFDGTRAAGLRSFCVFLFLLPANMWLYTLYPPFGMESFTPARLGHVMLVQWGISFVLTILYLLALSWAFKRTKALWRFFEASNWVSLIAFFVMLPVMFLAISGTVPRDVMDRGLMVIALYGYVVLACVFYKTYDLNWQLSGFLSIMMLLADQHAWEAMRAIMDVPYPWNY